MKPLIITSTDLSPEISFDPEHANFTISGTSRPEDVRSFYYPILEWCREFLDAEIVTGKTVFDEHRPLKLVVKLRYFNSSSAKFLYDIFLTLGNINKQGQHIDIQWYYEEGDDDMYDAGVELSEIAEVPFRFIVE